jgi:Tfp pilus assembly ATPase PilU
MTVNTPAPNQPAARRIKSADAPMVYLTGPERYAISQRGLAVGTEAWAYALQKDFAEKNGKVCEELK